MDWYACRWGVEVWHRILKSGCRIEARQLETAERLQRCLPLYSGIAWRIFYATMLSRAGPDGRVRRCRHWRNGRPCIGHPSDATPPEHVHPCARPYTGLPSWAASWLAGAMGNPGRWCCGKGFNISRISRLCTVSCARPPEAQKIWVKIS